MRTEEPYIALLMTGTWREADFLLKLLPHMSGDVNYDVFLVLRHSKSDEISRLGAKEVDFDWDMLAQHKKTNIFVCELPPIDPGSIMDRHVIPTGPTEESVELAMHSMFHGIFAGVNMIKAALRPYTHVMKTRTDYLPWIAPWITGTLEKFEDVGHRVIVDGILATGRRYPERFDIHWQGSVSEMFTFSSYDQFLKIWDFEDIFSKVCTGISETTFFRAALYRHTGDDMQSPRRNVSLLNKLFWWEQNDSNKSLNMLRPEVLSDALRAMLVSFAQGGEMDPERTNKLIRCSYDFIAGDIAVSELEAMADNLIANQNARAEFLTACHDAA